MPASAAPARHASPTRLGKVRSPLGCWLLVFITLGIYELFWYHHTNRELRDYDSSIVVRPALAVLALFLPIVGLFSVYNTGKRIRQAQTIAGIPADASGVTRRDPDVRPRALDALLHRQGQRGLGSRRRNALTPGLAGDAVQDEGQ